MNRLQRISLFTLLAICAPLRAAVDGMPAAPIQHLPVMAATEYFRHDSPTLGRGFHVFVNRPEHDGSDRKHLPVIFLLDGDQTFPLMSSYAYYLSFMEEMPPAILVGIAYGTTDPAINRRNHDFTAAAASNPDFGGADRFLQMLEDELIPHIEQRFGTDPGQRILVGQSLGGQLVLHAALRRPGLFRLGIAVNPALHRNLDYYLEALHAHPPRANGDWLYVSSAEQDDPRFRAPALTWFAAARATAAAGACLKLESLADETHLSSLPRAFRNAMRWYAQGAATCRDTQPGRPPGDASAPATNPG